MKCPRRFDSPGSPFKILGGEDHWYSRDGYFTCSYCGSLSSEELFSAISEGVELEPTDKNYKMYVNLPSKDTRLHVLSITSFDPKDERYTRVADLPQELYQVVVEDGAGRDPENTWVQLGTKTKVFGKFYFQHLNDDQKRKFIEMMNEKTLNLAYPGYFYRRPFFCKVIG